MGQENGYNVMRIILIVILIGAIMNKLENNFGNTMHGCAECKAYVWSVDQTKAFVT